MYIHTIVVLHPIAYSSYLENMTGVRINRINTNTLSLSHTHAHTDKELISEIRGKLHLHGMSGHRKLAEPRIIPQVWKFNFYLILRLNGETFCEQYLSVFRWFQADNDIV